jgi:hypothetical protein
MSARRPLLFSGLAGWAGGVLFFLGIAWAQDSAHLPVPLQGWLAAAAFIFCLAFSIAEMPIMVFGLKKMSAEPGGGSPTALMATNAFYAFFASAYAVVFLLLTGSVLLAAALVGLGVIRLGSSLVFVLPRSGK